MAGAFVGSYTNGMKVLLKQFLTKHNSLKEIPSNEGRVAIVTGGNKGIGLETAKALCLAQMTVILACRNTDAAEEAINNLKIEIPQAKVECMELDLSSLSSVQAFASNFKRKGLPLHILVNNAGVMFPPYNLTEDGFELQIGVNHLGHFALTYLLLEDLIKSGSPEQYSRIVTISSQAHLTGIINFEDLQSKNYYSKYATYAQSKLANVLFTYELQRRLEDQKVPVTANALHPGVVKTDLFQNVPFVLRIPQNVMAHFMFLTPQQGADTSVFVALSPSLERVGGKYYVNCESVSSSDESYKEDVQKTLWRVSCELTRINAQ